MGDLSAWKLKLPKSPLSYDVHYLYRKAAHHAGYKWEDFIELPGPVQSREVAFYEATLIEAVLQSGVIPG